jgi:hypothetical protein
MEGVTDSCSALLSKTPSAVTAVLKDHHDTLTRIMSITAQDTSKISKQISDVLQLIATLSAEHSAKLQNIYADVQFIKQRMHSQFFCSPKFCHALTRRPNR